MAWRDQLQPASFRQVKFHVAGTDGQIGRRTVLHEYPLRDLPYAEDMGRKSREFTLEAFVIGADYMGARDALIDAIEAPGPGELVHPFRGRMNVAITACRISESTDFGGMAKFSLTFVEAGQNLQPAAAVNTGAAVTVAADDATAVTINDFGDGFSVENLPEFVEVGALANLTTALASIQAAANGIIKDAVIMPEFVLQLSGVSAILSSLIRTPATLAGSLMSQIAALRGIALSPLDAFGALSNLFDFGADPISFPYVPSTTPSRSQQAANQAAVVSFVKRAALIEASRAASQFEFASYNEAIAVRDDLANRLETEAESAPDTAYTALTNLRIAVIRDITARGADLSRIVQYTPGATLPALVVAHQLYGDASKADEIVARNHIRHPGFVVGGQALEVLTA